MGVESGMPKRGTPPLQGELIQGTLDLLILKTLALGPAHGHTIAYAIEHRSDDVLQVEHGSLYPGAASPRGSRLDRVVLGDVGEQPPRALLPADAGRPPAARPIRPIAGTRWCARSTASCRPPTSTREESAMSFSALLPPRRWDDERARELESYLEHRDRREHRARHAARRGARRRAGASSATPRSSARRSTT